MDYDFEPTPHILVKDSSEIVWAKRNYIDNKGDLAFDWADNRVLTLEEDGFDYLADLYEELLEYEEISDDSEKGYYNLVSGELTLSYLTKTRHLPIEVFTFVSRVLETFVRFSLEDFQEIDHSPETGFRWKVLYKYQNAFPTPARPS